jgi:hypothetical protein
VNQASGQADPTNSDPIRFTAVFSEPINTPTFDNTDITIGGTAGGTKTATVTEVAPNNGTTFRVEISGMTTSGTVTASIAATRVTDLAGNTNTASTSTDNTVAWDVTAPSVSSITDGTSPTNAASLNFTVTFSEAVTGVDSSDFSVTTTSGISGAAVTNVTGSGASYTVSVNTGSGDGTVRLDGGCEVRVTRGALDGRRGRVAVGVRPEKIRLGPSEANTLAGRIHERSYVGVSTLYLVRTDHGTITVYVQNTEPGAQPAAPGDAVTLSFGAEAAFVVDSPQEVEQ